MKNLIIEFNAILEDAKMVSGKNGDYIALQIKQGYNSYRTYTKDLTSIELMPGIHTFQAQIKEFKGKYNMVVISIS